MTKNVAVLDNTSKVINITNVNDDYELLVNEFFYTDNNPAFIGGDYVEGYFYPLQPFPSWTRLEGQWVAPIPEPTEGNYYWDEQLGDWVEALAK
jgi:hypothetical protein